MSMSRAHADDFMARAVRYRAELRVHCYRMTASLEDAEDLVQETLLKAWQRHEHFEGRASLRTWLYRIATHTCPAALRRAPPAVVGDGGVEVPWLEPIPDELLDQVAAPQADPDAQAVARET